MVNTDPEVFTEEGWYEEKQTKDNMMLISLYTLKASLDDTVK